MLSEFVSVVYFVVVVVVDVVGSVMSMYVAMRCYPVVLSHAIAGRFCSTCFSLAATNTMIVITYVWGAFT